MGQTCSKSKSCKRSSAKKMIPVIYIIKHHESGRFYIGRTNNFDRRKREHLSQLSCGTHHNKKLLNIYKKHGRSSISIEVVEMAIGGNIEEIEQRWIDGYINHHLCLNTSSTSWMPKLSDLSNEQRSYIKTRASEHMKVANKDPKFIEKRDAASRKNMMKQWSDPAFVANHKTRSSEIMKRQNKKPEFVERMLAGIKKQHANPAIVEKRLAASANTWRRAVSLTRLSDGATFTFQSCKEAAEKFGLRQSSISMCCHGKSKTTGGYRCEFV